MILATRGSPVSIPNRRAELRAALNPKEVVSGLHKTD